MKTTVSLLAGLAGVAVLLGYFIESLAPYYLVPGGAALSILAAIINNWTGY